MKRDLLSIPPMPSDQRISYGRDPNQFLDLWIPRAPSAVALVIHGGYWRSKYDLSHASHLCAALAKRGLAVANLEYRRVGQPGGGWPGTYEDVRAGVSAVQQHFAHQKKFVVIGHSAGGHLALRLAMDASELSAVVALAPVAVLKTAYDLNLSNGAVVDFLGGTPSTVPQRYEDACPSRHPSVVPRRLIHGSADETIPVAISRLFVQARAGDPGPVTLLEIEGACHFDLIDPESNAWQTVALTLETLLASG